MKDLFSEADKRIIQDRFDELKKVCKKHLRPEGLGTIQKAYEFAYMAHNGVRRKSGEPYIIHPIAVAQYTITEVGLGTKSAVAALLHDVVEDTEYTVEDIKSMFGDKVAVIVDGLTKLSGNFDSSQAENFKKMILTLSEDLRVILIKLADRLHNMQTLESMPRNKQLKIAGETLFIYAPMAHRLGLYGIKTELEDLALKYEHPEAYEKIRYQLHDKEAHRRYLVDEFVTPIKSRLDEEGIKCNISSRPKSIYSIWNKMQKKGISFDEIYDILAVRIVFTPIKEKSEKRQSFDILSLITDYYKPKPDRIRDWITLPKANGYESLHVTVMGPRGKWVEVQIRTKRMDEIAEKGLAAHYKYKDLKGQESPDTELDRWLERIKETLRNPESDALTFLDEFKLNLFASEIVVFSPKGHMISLPKDATVLDFAYDIHTDLGNKCIGAKINHKLVGVGHKLQTGDQVEILTSDSQKPLPTWLEQVATAKAKNKIKSVFKLQEKQHITKGKNTLDEAFKKLKIVPHKNTLKKLLIHFSLSNKEQLYAQIGMGLIQLKNLSSILKVKTENRFVKYWRLTFSKNQKEEEEEDVKSAIESLDKKKTLLLEENNDDIGYQLAPCCQPIPGDQVIGFITDDKALEIHKTQCPIALKLMSSHGDQIIPAQWTTFKMMSHLARIKMKGFDRLGIVNEITNIISKQHNINMRKILFDTNDGIFEGEMFLYIHNASDLNTLIAQLIKVKGMESVERLESLVE